MPTFTPPRKVEIILTDDAGNKRIAVAERARGGYASQPHWSLVLGHPSGKSWPADFNGNNVLDALGELIERKDHEFHTSRGRASSQMLPDRNVPVDEAGAFTRASITTHNGHQVAFGRAAAAAARERSEKGSGS